MRALALTSADGRTFACPQARRLTHVTAVVLHRPNQDASGRWRAAQGGLFALEDGEPVRLLLEAPPRAAGSVHETWLECGLEHAIGGFALDDGSGPFDAVIVLADLSEGFLAEFLAMRAPEGADRVLAAYAREALPGQGVT